MLTLLTATGCRLEAWKICQELMMMQSYTGTVRWIIVDDGETPQEITFKRDGWSLELICPTPTWKQGQNTQARNLMAGLNHITDTERVAVIEDDDYYGVDYLSDVSKWLDNADLVGEPMARYFNVQTGVGRQLNNKEHASLCSTAVKGSGIKALRKSVATNLKFIDMELWKQYRGKKSLSNTKHVVGIKGLPGRCGIGIGHRNLTGDKSGHLLRNWIGKDASIYGY